jgi:hypothetical protein
MASNSRLLTSFNDVNSLEYGTLKILYEVLNKRFRYTQHQLRSINFRFGRGFQTFQAEIDRAAELGGEPLDEKAVEELKLLRDRLNEFGQEFRKVLFLSLNILNFGFGLN